MNYKSVFIKIYSNLSSYRVIINGYRKIVYDKYHNNNSNIFACICGNRGVYLSLIAPNGTTRTEYLALKDKCNYYSFVFDYQNSQGGEIPQNFTLTDANYSLPLNGTLTFTQI